MRLKPRIFSSKLTRTERLVYGAVTVFFILSCLVTIWPIYPYFSHALPLVLGLPFGLFFLAVVLVVSFSALLAVYLWEGRRERPDSRSSPAEERR